jgi:hypothetical protein
MDRYRIFRRGQVWYLENDATGKQTSLHTRDKREALRVLHAHGEAQQTPTINLQIARAYMNAADENYAKRTWGGLIRHIVEGYDTDSESYRRWLIRPNSNPCLAVIAPQEMQNHIPRDHGSGYWESVEIPLAVFNAHFQPASL